MRVINNTLSQLLFTNNLKKLESEKEGGREREGDVKDCEREREGDKYEGREGE